MLAQNSAVGIGSHASGVRPGIAVADALVILRRFERQNVFAVAEPDEADFFALQEFFHYESRSQYMNRFARLLFSMRDDDAFSGSEPVGFYYQGQREFLYIVKRFSI